MRGAAGWEQAHIVEAAPGRLRVAIGPLRAGPRDVTLTEFDALRRREP